MKKLSIIVSVIGIALSVFSIFHTQTRKNLRKKVMEIRNAQTKRLDDAEMNEETEPKAPLNDVT